MKALLDADPKPKAGDATNPTASNPPFLSALASSEKVKTSGDDGDYDHVHLAEMLQSLSVAAISDRFFGKSSGFMLMKTAMDLKMECAGPRSGATTCVHRRPEFWQPLPVRQLANPAHAPSKPRPYTQWERIPVAEKSHYVFPEDDLLDTLISVYFDKVNLFWPLLHRPTLQRSLRARLHDHDSFFGATILLVCALASRFVDDPRVLLDEADPSLHSSGWKWYSQVKLVRGNFSNPPTLHELQAYPVRWTVRDLPLIL